MANYRLTKAAENDLFNIYQYSVENFGLEKAREYFSIVKQGYRRYEHKSHSVYYTSADEIILIVRILGSAQDPIKNLAGYLPPTLLVIASHPTADDICRTEKRSFNYCALA